MASTERLNNDAFEMWMDTPTSKWWWWLYCVIGVVCLAFASMLSITPCCTEELTRTARRLVDIVSALGYDFVLVGIAAVSWECAVWVLVLFVLFRYTLPTGLIYFLRCLNVHTGFSCPHHCLESAFEFEPYDPLPLDIAIDVNPILSFRVETRYADYATHWIEVFIIFIAQSMLTAFVCSALIAHPLQVITNQDLVYWGCSLPVQFMAQRQMGKSFKAEGPMWKVLFRVEEQVHRMRNPKLKTLVNYRQTSNIPQPHRMTIVYRCLLSLIANNFYYNFLLYALPLTLMSVTSHLDFVRDTFAIVYIATLDDLSEPREYCVLEECDVDDAQYANPQEQDDRWVPRSSPPRRLGSGWDNWLGGIAGGRSSRSFGSGSGRNL